MEAVVLYASLLLLPISGLLFVASINHYKRATRYALETHELAMRVLAKNKR